MHRPEERPRALRLVDGRCPARHPAYRKRKRPVFVTLDDCSGSVALRRSSLTNERLRQRCKKVASATFLAGKVDLPMARKSLS